MDQGDSVALGVQLRRVLTVTFAVFGVAAAVCVFAAGFAVALVDVDNPRIASLLGMVFWAQAVAAGGLVLVAGALFVLSNAIRHELIVPLDYLRQSLAAAGAGAIMRPIWGTERSDEIGALAREAEKLRQCAVTGANAAAPYLVVQTIGHLSKAASHLESELGRSASVTRTARERIERAGLQAAKTSRAAVEALGLAREHSAEIAAKAREIVDAAGIKADASAEAMEKIAARITKAAVRLERIASTGPAKPGSAPPADLAGTSAWLLERMARPDTQDAKDIHPSTEKIEQEPRPPATDYPPDEHDETARVFEGLLGDLEALERFALTRKDIAGDQAVTITAALIEAIDRLNSVADHVSAAADRHDIEAA